MIYIVSHHPILTSLLVWRFELTASECSADFCLYKNDSVTLIDLPEDVSVEAITPEYLLGATRIFDVAYAFWVGNEHYIGDIVLPNVFLTLHPELKTSDIHEWNAEGFFSDSLFMTQYEDQKDYDFGKFSLSIGWISVSGKEFIHEDVELLEKVRIAYEPDTYVVGWYETIEHLRAMSGREDIYAVQGLLTGEKLNSAPAENIERYVWENIVNFVKYFVDDFLEWDGEMSLNIK